MPVDTLSYTEMVDELRKGPIPEHLAIIMDGNGRWAKARGLVRMLGHQAGVSVLDELIRTVKSLGIRYVTVYAFSTENWKRPEREISGLMNLLLDYLNKKLPLLMDEGVCLHAIGEISGLPEKVQKTLAEVEDATKKNNEVFFNLALNYGGRQEILQVCQSLAIEVSSGVLSAEDIDEKLFSQYLYTSGQPDPDLLIRTSGEMRISNFLLWQIAYSEIWITETLWPDFSAQDLFRAISSYQKRDRRFGGLSNP